MRAQRAGGDMAIANQPGTFRNSGGVLSNRNQPSPRWVYVVVLIGALLMALGGVIALVNPAMLVSPHDQINGAVHVYAGYLASCATYV